MTPCLPLLPQGRWLHLFQLVEKQYQEQILAQQEQYQCQIQVSLDLVVSYHVRWVKMFVYPVCFFPQLIQDEIKALVQLQNRPASIQPHTEFSPLTKTTTDTKGYIFPLLTSDCTLPKNVASDSDSLAAPAHNPFSSPSPPLHRSETANQQGEERATTVLSSGYGTLSAWDTALEPAGSPGEDEDGGQEREKHHWPLNFQEDTETAVIGCQQDLSNERTVGVEEANLSSYQQRTSG